MLMNLQSAEADEPTGKLNFKLKFWQDVAPVECLKAHIKKVVFKNFRGERSELAFLRFVLERAQILQTLVVVLTDGDGDHASQEELAHIVPVNAQSFSSLCAVEAPPGASEQRLISPGVTLLTAEAQAHGLAE
ncbi:Os01g0595800 [Oryza sativa Japonica Group]|uniref:Os01g0595800 protein n=1 Tax=Oryza sativa subsp. japonica TaxID=39947 RepID=A0A0P0V4T2_ORYSJ|nr:hypothetical protein EE612_003858 [Oryza sativa]BAS72987.1 Os01g0595800 [Oryza sativa Japonica Group]